MGDAGDAIGNPWEEKEQRYIRWSGCLLFSIVGSIERLVVN